MKSALTGGGPTKYRACAQQPLRPHCAVIATSSCRSQGQAHDKLDGAAKATLWDLKGIAFRPQSRPFSRRTVWYTDMTAPARSDRASSHERHRQQRISGRRPTARAPEGRTKLRQSLRAMRDNCGGCLRAGGFRRRHYRAAYFVAAHVRHQRTGSHPPRRAGQRRELHEIRSRPAPARARPRPRTSDQRGRDLAAPSPHHGAGVRSAQRRRLRADHDRRDRRTAGEMGRAAGAARSRRCRGDDARRPCTSSRARCSLRIPTRSSTSSKPASTSIRRRCGQACRTCCICRNGSRA